MKITDESVKNVAENISNYTYQDNLQATRELMELFNKIFPNDKLSDFTDYVQKYDDCFYTFQTWNDLIRSEIEQGDYGLTENECKMQLGETIWQLPCGWYIQKVG